MRNSNINRKTSETDINISIDIDGSGKYNINSGCGFLDHMLTLFSRHGRFDLDVSCKGDTYVDYHHTVEDIGIALGQAFSKAVGDKRGIIRYADAIIPMDETLILCALDISGRGELYCELNIPTEKVGDFDTQLCEEFWRAFSRDAGITLHLRQITGINSHHIIEGTFKAVARCLRCALAVDEKFYNEIPSTKGII